MLKSPTINSSILIGASPDEVWAALADISTHVDWMADAEAIRFRSDQRSGLGTVFDCDTKIGPFRLVDEMEITAWQPGQTMGVRHAGLVTGTGAFTLTAVPSPTASGTSAEATEFSWTETLQFPWWLAGPLGGWVASPVLRAVWRGNLRRLKAMIESS